MKKMFFTGVIAYSIALFILQDLPLQTAATGAMNYAFLGKLVIDVFFAGYAAFKLFGKDWIPQDDDDDEITHIDASEVSIPDNWLYGLFGINLIANAGFHMWLTGQTTGGESVWFTAWFLGEVALLLLTFVFFKHAQAAYLRRLAADRKNKVRNISTAA